MTLPQGPRACSTAAMVDGSSHSANASLVLGGSAADADSGFSLYVRPMRMWSRLRSEEHTSELQSRLHLVCRLLLEKKKINKTNSSPISYYTAHIICTTKTCGPPL